eukprot:gnl/TRDRNA2_/TRDRNA2_37290_c0_seq1.p1 gnl/TRDRNA2_/TRDRNA2_37290_c0~~gnl/TRDRNA2_/TRDRNA2_37290_c0_seq1.p1  ORF type:complete len:222 (-),score=47.98 gnl/TRDRNA2_/TRDRNA2_37290_c0_seq1:220-885(-)
MKVIAALALLFLSATAEFKNKLNGHFQLTVSETDANNIIVAFGKDPVESFCLSEALARAIASSLSGVDAEMVLITGISKIPSGGNRRLGALRRLAAATNLRIDYVISLPAEDEHATFAEVQKNIADLGDKKAELISSMNQELNEISGLSGIRIKGVVHAEVPVPMTTTSKTTTTTGTAAAEDDGDKTGSSNDDSMLSSATSCGINHLTLSGLAVLTAFIRL